MKEDGFDLVPDIFKTEEEKKAEGDDGQTEIEMMEQRAQNQELMRFHREQ